MGFNPTFYAGRPKLSEVTIDSDLNMGGRNISGVDTIRGVSEVTIDSDLNMGGRNISGVDTLRAGRVDSPYRPESWPTEELNWGDVAAGNPVDWGGDKTFGSSDTTLTLFTHSGSGRRYTVNLTVGPGSVGALAAGATIKVGGVAILTLPGVAIGGSYTTPSFPVDNGKQVTITGSSASAGYCSLTVLQYTNTGIAAGAKTFQLTDKWLAVGLDMKGLAATVKIQGVNVPYSDYAKYFPLAPTEITIPGGWDASQIRPIVEVYL